VTREFPAKHAGASGSASRWLLGSMSRSEFFAALSILCCINGLGARAIDSVHQLGWAAAVFATFEISAIVWVACGAGIWLILSESSDEVRRADIALGAVLLVPIALPIGGFSWLALTILSLYVILFSAPSSARRRGAVILLAVTVPMLWSRLLFKYFANFLLEIDAMLVSWLLGTPRAGNMVRFVDDSGSLVILPYCSSLANVSLALLAWVAISQWTKHRWSRADLQWCTLAVISVIAVNVTRMGLMGLSDTYYRAIHSPWGDALANALILCITIGFCLLGVTRAPPVRA
jgi:hypothetical protein